MTPEWRDDYEDAASPPGEPPSGTVSRTRRCRFRRPSTYVVAFVMLAFLLLVGDGAYVVVRLSSALPQVDADLRGGRDALEIGDLEGARSLFENASQSAEMARKAAGHPSMRIGEILPVIGLDAKALGALARAAWLGAKGALAAVDAAGALGLEAPRSEQTVYRDGRVDLHALDGARPHFAKAATSLARAAETLSPGIHPNIGRLRDALVAAREGIEDAVESVAKANTLLSVLPGLLGGEGERRYLLAFQALGEARGTGGVVGIYGVLHALDGRLSLGKIRSYGGIQQELTEPVDAPAWFARSYDLQNARERWAQANLTPNFRAAAQVMLNMFETATGKRLDGAIAMDPITLSAFMSATGPIPDPASGELVAADGVSDVLLRDSYVLFPNRAEQDEFLRGLVRNFWTRLESGVVGPEAIAAVGETASNGHLKVYTTDPEEQDAMAALGADGNYASLGPSVQLVFNNNYAVNKVDYFLFRMVETKVELQSEGGATFTTSVTVENRAPSGPPSILLGRGSDGLSPGANRMVLAAALPRGAEVERIDRNGETLTPFTYEDSGHMVVWDRLTVPPGGTERLMFVYSIGGPPMGSGGELSLTLVPQTTVNPERFSFELIPAPGSQVIEATGAVILGGRAFAGGKLVEPRPMSFVLQSS